MRRLLTGIVFALSAAIGVLAFLYPFLLPANPQTSAALAAAQSKNAPLLTAALVGLTVIAMTMEVQGKAVSAKLVAMLGVLVAMTSALRVIEIAFPVPGGFSPIFAPIALVGYTFGSRFGFQMGAFTLLVSAIVSGSVGPWLPYQMFTAGWMGLSAGWLATCMQRVGRVRAPGRADVLVLSSFGFAWGLLYGAITNIWFWPFAVGPVEQTWAPGASLWDSLARYAAFYLATSLAWDLARAVGNAALILLLGSAVLRALTRFRQRFHFEVSPADA